MKLICIGGMDGIGKTSMINHFARHHIPVITEINPNNTLISNTLKQFYIGEIDRLFYQMIFLYSNIDRYKKITKSLDKDFVISDRSFIEDIIFAEVLLEGNDLENYKTVYFHHMDKIFKDFQKPALYVILKGSFEKVTQRLETKAFEAQNNDLDEFVESNVEFYKKLYKNYSSKTSTFLKVLEKHKIPVVEFDIEGDSKKENFKKFLVLLKKNKFNVI